MKQIINWFEIPVRDLARAQTFYEAVLQISMPRENYAGPGMQMAIFLAEDDATKGALMAGHPGLQVGARGTLVYLYAGPSLNAALQRVLAQGGKVEMEKTALPDSLGFMAHILDLDGNLVGLHTHA